MVIHDFSFGRVKVSGGIHLRYCRFIGYYRLPVYSASSSVLPISFFTHAVHNFGSDVEWNRNKRETTKLTLLTARKSILMMQIVGGGGNKRRNLECSSPSWCCDRCLNHGRYTWRAVMGRRLLERLRRRVRHEPTALQCRNELHMQSRESSFLGYFAFDLYYERTALYYRLYFE